MLPQLERHVEPERRLAVAPHERQRGIVSRLLEVGEPLDGVVGVEHGEEVPVRHRHAGHLRSGREVEDRRRQEHRAGAVRHEPRVVGSLHGDGVEAACDLRGDGVARRDDEADGRSCGRGDGRAGEELKVDVVAAVQGTSDGVCQPLEDEALGPVAVPSAPPLLVEGRRHPHARRGDRPGPCETLTDHDLDPVTVQRPKDRVQGPFGTPSTSEPACADEHSQARQVGGGHGQDPTNTAR